uniref:Uncharacterized protein n=1 Tax=Cannabis sativa TaxID=3483 RepID=A0A803QZX3_CANSA
MSTMNEKKIRIKNEIEVNLIVTKMLSLLYSSPPSISYLSFHSRRYSSSVEQPYNIVIREQISRPY